MRASWEYARRGFTLVEMLGVIAILVIAFAVAVPNAFTIRSNLRMMQLDEQAHQIYNVAQNRLTALQSTGQLNALRNELDQNDNYSFNIGNTVPIDYPSSGNTDPDYWDTHELRCMHSSNPVVSRYLVTQDGAPLTQSLNGGHFVIEFSPLTAEVYSVFYWENDASIGKADAENATYADLAAVCSADRSRLTRFAHRIGYYCGGELGSHAVSVKLEDVPHAFDIQVVNSEELYVRVTGGGKGTESLGMSDFDPQRIQSMSLSVNDTESFLTVEGDDLLVDPVKGVDVRFVLDSMRRDADLSFKTLSAPYPNLSPGMDITVRVRISYETDNGVQDFTLTNLQGVESFTVNSLFESIDDGTVKVSCVRHLNNLRQNVLNDGQALGNFSTIELTRDIDFDGSTWSVDGDPSAGQTVSATSRRAGTSKKNLNPLAFFTPIDGSEANAFRPTDANKDTDAVFKGKGFALKNFRIGEGSDKTKGNGIGATNDYSDVGLFSKVYFKVENLTLDNLHAVGGKHVGAFAGSAGYSATFSNCNITGNSTVSGVSEVGGVCGSTASSAKTAAFDNCSVQATVSATKGNTGGIVGKADALAHIASCTASGTVANSSRSSASSVGGIVGRIGTDGADTDITSCTADCTVTSNGGEVGGIVGTAGRCGTIESCKVSNVVSGTENIGGVAGLTQQQAHDVTFERCNVTAAVEGSAGHAGGIIGRAHGCKAIRNCSVDAAVSTGEGTWRDGKPGASCLGGIVGRADCNIASIEDCAVGMRHMAHLEASSAGVGGIVGLTEHDIALVNCSVRAQISAGENGGSCSYAGGLLGYASTADSENGHYAYLSKCTVEEGSIVASTGMYTGGLAGYYEGSASGCRTIAYVSAGASPQGGYSFAGGAFGSIRNGSVQTFSSCRVGTGRTAPDIYATGSHVGGFAGTAQRAHFSKCRVYGATRSGGTWFYAKVTGKSYTGGFLGMTGYLDPYSGGVSEPNENDVQIITSFSAIDVVGRGNASRVGGFVGFGSGQSVISSCYSSGKVRASTNVGGFAGLWRNNSSHTALDSCYTTSDVTGGAQVGGFVGMFTRSSNTCRKLTNCVSYGRVMASYEGASSLGQFCGHAESFGTTGSSDTCYGAGCAYLKRNASGYNTFTARADQPKGLDDQHIDTFFNTMGLSAADSHPYSSALQGQRFPYGAVIFEGTALPHYGDWPQEVAVR